MQTTSTPFVDSIVEAKKTITAWKRANVTRVDDDGGASAMHRS
jgi:hypothetical protein